MMFPERIKYLRQTQGLNQVQLADKLGTTKQSISNWENDNIVPSVDMLEKIADFFRVSTDYLLGREKKPVTGVRLIDVTGLTSTQISHIMALIDDLRNKYHVFADTVCGIGFFIITKNLYILYAK